ncbi:TPA: hypothetical protein ACSP5O_002409 [Aeromonas veronii]
MYAPICLFVYNRFEHTVKTIAALQQNTIAAFSDIYIFSDAPRNEKADEEVRLVREFIKTITGFKSITIIEADKNKGLARSIISGVSHVIELHGKVIVFEDDLISSPITLEYLNLMLGHYEEHNEVMSITSYSYPRETVEISSGYEYENYFTGRPCSWGWATWRDRWELIKWDGEIYNEYRNNVIMQREFMKYSGVDIDRMLKKQLDGDIDSWAVRFVFNCFLLKKVASYPTRSYITNIGSDGSGTHKGVNEDKITNKVLLNELPEKISMNFKIEPDILKCFNRFVKKKYYFKRLVFIAKGLFS